MAKRALWAVLTAIGLVLLVGGAWFTYHLGSSGSATFRATPGSGLVVVEPSVLNRVDDPVTVTAHARGGQAWIGRTTPSDARAVVGSAAHTAVTGVRLSSWRLATTQDGQGGTGADGSTLVGSDVWRQSVTGRTGTARIQVDQGDAPEALVVTTPDGRGTIDSVTVTIERRTWFAQSLLAVLLGLIAVAAGVVGLVGAGRHRDGTGPQERRSPHAPLDSSTLTIPTTEVKA